MKKKIIGLMLAFAMVAGCISGCGQSETQKEETKSSEKAESKTESNVEKEEATEKVDLPDPIGAYNWVVDESLLSDDPTLARHDGVEFTYVVNSDGSTLPEGETMEENALTWRFEVLTGMKPKVLWSASGQAFTDKLNANIAAGEIPDLLSVNLQQYYMLAKAGMIHDLTDYYDEYAPTIKEAYEAGGEGVFENLKVDGRVYGIPRVYGSGDTSSVLWIRTDWLDKLGLEEPTTFSDLEEIMTAFVELDPDGNGEDDTVGMPFYGFNTKVTEGGWSNISTITMNMGDALTGGWQVQDDGTVIYGSLHKDNVKALEMLNDWYNKGLIPENFSTMTGAECTELIANGKAGVVYGPTWAPWSIFTANVNMDPAATWETFALTEDGKSVFKVNAGGPTFGIYVISKEFEDPSMIIHAWNRWNTSFGYDGFGDYNFTPIATQHNPFNWNLHPDIFVKFTEYMERIAEGEFATKEDLDKELAEVGGGLLDNSGIIWDGGCALKEEDPHNAVSQSSGASWYIDFLARYHGLVLFRKGEFVSTEYQGFTPSMEMYQSFLNGFEKDAYINMISGNTNGLSISEYFDKFVEDYLAQGGAEITAEVQKEIDAR